ncbi:Crp/Fnr family transcriptional regulator [Pseudorhodobacter sp.]|uniref:Crp/Fnr family transcriptional regulator n=1 Tax=Pseudorhodobacter sp. TaxID=1934400 RepID=UPI002647F53E|nr:Crp/Fnr family transcriptional regulator [Pseudorhodobacter sp.]MDN5788285.1 Crp/Fnr family transcriptional regulator [Pseudorhodobacter sp.]
MKKLDESLLLRLPPFSQLSRAQIRKILDQAQTKRLDEGGSFFSEGEEATRFYLLLDGHIRVIKTTPAGDQIIVLHIAAGQLFGIAAALGHSLYPATAQAAAESLALSWPMPLLQEFSAIYQGFATENYKVVGARMQEMQSRISEMATQQVEQRVATALLRLTNQAGRKTDEGIEIDFPITRQDISEMTGTTLHTVSRLLSGWEKQGIILSTRKRIVIVEAHQLVRISDNLT